MQHVAIYVAGKELALTPGLKRGQELMSLANISAPEQLVFEVANDVDVALASNDAIIIRGGEKFSVGDGNPLLPDNPTMRAPVTVTVNGQPVSEAIRGRRAKATYPELVNWGGGGSQDLWLDLENLADEQLKSVDRIVLQASDRFLTVPREAQDPTYEVTVLLDGDDQVRSFPVVITVLEAIRLSLSPRDREDINAFAMVNVSKGTNPLDPNTSLKDAGVLDGHILSITKKNGGGG